MESIVAKLVKLDTSPNYSVESTLAKKLIDNFLRGIFQSQQELAKELFISESAITKFCQKLGYSGFREFSERFKIEYEKYVLSKQQVLDHNSFIQKFLLSINEINLTQDFFDFFKSQVFKKRGLLIIPSFQAEDAALFLRDYLVNQGIDAKCFNVGRNGILSIEQYLDTDYPILFIFLGPDTAWLYRYYQKFKSYSEERIFLIVSTSQNDCFLDVSQKFVLTSYLKYSSYFYRKIILELIFLAIFEKTN